MSPTTKDLKAGLKKMLKNRGSMTVKEEALLRNVLSHLEEYEKLNEKGDRVRTGVLIVEMLLRFLLNPEISDQMTTTISALVDQLL